MVEKAEGRDRSKPTVWGKADKSKLPASSVLPDGKSGGPAWLVVPGTSRETAVQVDSCHGLGLGLHTQCPLLVSLCSQQGWAEGLTGAPSLICRELLCLKKSFPHTHASFLTSK